LAAGASPVIDECRYADDAAARAVWQPMRDSVPVAVATVAGRAGLRMVCNFAATKMERASWDRVGKLDLAPFQGVEFRFLTRNARPVAHFNIYFQSGEGWYTASFFPQATGAWETITINKAGMRTEGRPAGWGSVRTIRVSAWRGRDEDTAFHVADFRGFGVLGVDAQVAIVGGAAYAETVSRLLAGLGIRHATLSEAEATPERLKAARLVIVSGSPRSGAVAPPHLVWKPESSRRADAAGQSRALAALIGKLAPEVLRPAVEALAGGAPRMRGQVRKLAAQGKYAEAFERAAAERDQRMEAFYRKQKPLKGEFRAFWCHRAAGVEGMEWDEAIRRLAANGFNAILPNMLWGGAAFYPSEVLPVAVDANQQGDQVAACLTACRKYGVAMHVWKVNWNLGRYGPVEFRERMRKESRLQVSSRGVEEPWLCPSHPENQKLEIASMVELARKYEVDGIHFDYIRYPDGDHCFCAGCRERFARAAGVTIADWPRDVMGDGPHRQPWLDWRRANITAVVKAVSEQARAVRPRVKISAAVFRNWTMDRDGVGQDWKLWCERGYLDFVCPMDYTESDAQFDTWVPTQKQWAGKVPVYPGIGASASSSLLGADRVIGQIQIARRYKTGGFVVFNYGAREAAELLPKLGLGITRR
jgi:uncharacterized lipoprotein YddW (UPF0748 family)